MKRLFLAIEPPPLVHEALVAHQAELKGLITRQGVRFVREDKLHLTLVFLGSADEAEVISKVSGVLTERQTSPISLVLTGLGAFPHPQRPKVIWQGVSASPELSTLVRDLQTKLAVTEDAEFAPHITLARVNPGSKEVGWLIHPIVTRASVVEAPRWDADRLTLYESAASGDYLPLHAWPLSS